MPLTNLEIGLLSKSKIYVAGINAENSYRLHFIKPRKLPMILNVRFFKRLLNIDKGNDRTVFIVRSDRKVEAGQVIYSNSEKTCTFVSTIQSFSAEALIQIRDFMRSLEMGMIDELVINDNNEIIFH